MVNCYTERGSHVFVCFVDLSKLFDRVSYWKLFVKLLHDNVRVFTKSHGNVRELSEKILSWKIAQKLGIV